MSDRSDLIPSHQLPFANAATIVRAHQKDAYFETGLIRQLHDVLTVFKGQRFVNMYPEEITVTAKSLYLILTTLIGARTLGEEYVDLVYVNRTGNRLPGLGRRLCFVLSYAIVPYVVVRIVKYLKSKGDYENKNRSWIMNFAASYMRVLDTLMNLHIAVFYFHGHFYSISKRVFGLRYAFGHNKSANDMSKAGNYSFLGVLILLQFAVKSLIKFKAYTSNKNDKFDEQVVEDVGQFDSVTRLENLSQMFTKEENLDKKVNIDLSDPGALPYIPENSRTCMLCLSPMINPAAANCGHFFCWNCIVDWIRQNPECALCRQNCYEQNLLPLR